MTVFVAIVRLALAIVFVVSAVAKYRDRAGSRDAVVAFGVPGGLAGLVAAALPLVELVAAVLLVLADPFATLGALVSLLLLLAFTIAIAVNLVRGRRPQCHCFGSLGGEAGISWVTVGRNALLMALAGVSLVGAGGLRSVPSEFTGLEPEQRWLLLAGAVLVAAIVGLALALLSLIARYGSVLLRVEALERAAGIAEPEDAPDFELADLMNGTRVSLDDILAARKPVLLAFVSPTCHNCTELLPDLAAWQGDDAHPLSVVVVSDGSVADNRAKLEDVAPLQVLLQAGREVAQAYEILGTPAAVLVGVDGRLAGTPVHGAGGVRDLHDRTAHLIRGGATDAGHGHQTAPTIHNVGQRPVDVGDSVPALEVIAEDGSSLGIEDAVGPDAVVLFWRVTCGFCRGILDDVAKLEAATTVRIVTDSPAEDVRESGLASPILRDVGGALQGWLRVPGTPSAVRIADGALASSVAVGGPAVLEVLRSSSRESAQAKP